jgi:hypothetical protein
MVTLGGIKRYNAVKFVVVDEVDAAYSTTLGTSNLSSTLNELLSKYLSPTFDDGSAAELSVTACGAPTITARFDRATNHLCSADSSTPHFLKLCVQKSGPLQEPAHICLRSGSSIFHPLEHAYLVCSSPEKSWRPCDACSTNSGEITSEHPKGFNLFRFASSSGRNGAIIGKGVADGGGVY